MASINKLSIRGVRAFNPEDVEQVRHHDRCVLLVLVARLLWRFATLGRALLLCVGSLVVTCG